MSELPHSMESALDGPGSLGLKRLLAHNEWLFAVGLATVLATLLIPLPEIMLDMLLSISIAVALSTLIIVLSTREAIEFNTFPSLLLFVTLFRLSLNVASTRLILSQGSAGYIIETFGRFVAGGSAGGNLVIGLVVFLILVIIQFVVITKGSERISEVAARFNLDAMPGKQMAIDADLNAGLIGEEEARSRRETIVQQSEFYGAMDGASKFIRGDAIAGLIITGVNLVGGFLVGMMTQRLTAAQSIERYSVLAIGDGLVSQIPAVIISTSAGFLISKTSSKKALATDLTSQMLRRSRPLTIVSFLLAGMIFVPGFPKTPFIILSVGMGLLARSLRRSEKQAARPKEKVNKQEAESEQPVEELLDIDRISILVGPRLIRTVDPRRPNSLSHRISPLRRKFAERYGLILPLVRLRDNVSLEPNSYEIRINNHVIADGRLEPDMLLAMDPGTVQTPIEGIATQEPVFKLPALWITQDRKEDAELRGYTVVDPESVLVTHLSEVLRKNAHELITRDDVQTLVDRLREKQPALVNSVVGELAPVGLIHRVLQSLLKDGIPIRDMPQILETLGDHAGRTKDAAALTEMCRKALVRTITEQHIGADGTLSAIVFEPTLEYDLRKAIAGGEDGGLNPERAMALCQGIVDAWKNAMEQGFDGAVLLCDSRLRSALAGMLERQLPQLAVIAYDEVAPGTDIQSVGTVTLQLQGQPAGAR